MSFIIPDSLDELRRWLQRKGLDVTALKSERQAAFMAQQLAGTRFKFPPKGASCFTLLQKIQGALPERAAVEKPQRRVKKASKGSARGKIERGQDHRDQRARSSGAAQGAPAEWDKGMVIFSDGGCEPNPGAGGWAFVVYRNGVETHAECGGADPTTNNIMEMTGALMALRWFASRDVVEPVRVFSDSQYVVKGCNEWRHGWKKKGWRRGVEKELANADLWRELDAALTLMPITLEWVKGHAGVIGNERADELSIEGRQKAIPHQSDSKRLIEQQLQYMV